MNILNIHGFDGSPYNTNYNIAIDCGYNVYSIAMNYRDEALIKLRSQLQEIVNNNKIDVVLATSFGSFIGKQLSVQNKIRLICSNPCFRPDITLRDIAPEYFNTHANDDTVNEWISIHRIASFDSDIIIVGDSDEVIDHSLTMSEINREPDYILRREGHRMHSNQYKELLSTVLRKCEDKL